MKIYRVDSGKFSINVGYTENSKIDLVWRDGEIYLSVSGICLNHEKQWYELPIKDIKSIDIVEGVVPLLKISGDTFSVTITSKNISTLKSLKFLIQPYIST